MTRTIPLWRLLGVIALPAVLTIAAGADAPKGLPLNPSRDDVLSHLAKLAPAERMRVLAKVLDKDKDFATIGRGPVSLTIIERGSLQAVETTDVHCRVRAVGKNSTIAAVIKWIIDDGTMVKQGEKLIEFDDSAHSELLRTQKAVVARTESDMKKAAAHVERDRGRGPYSDPGESRWCGRNNERP
ncbi:MAG: hypothetical protein HY289_03765 [Planctomycetes bacterium]|nr:hypothetical protein [Planctomycetota bacterium]